MLKWVSTTMVVLFLCVASLCITSRSSAQNRGKTQKSENPLLYQANASFLQADYTKSAGFLNDLFKQTDAKEKDLYNAHFLMGRCLDKQNKFDEAKYHFKLAISNGYDNEDVDSISLKPARNEVELYGEALLKYSDDDFDGSKKILEQLQSRNLYKKDQMEPFMLLARNEVQLKNDAKAREYFCKAIKINKNYEPDPGKLKDDELVVFLNVKQHGCGGGFGSFVKKSWYIVAGAAAAVAVVSSTRK